MMMQGGEKIISHPDSIAIMEKYAISHIPEPPKSPEGIPPKSPEGGLQRLAIDYDQLSQAIAQNADKLAKVNVHIDRNGFALYHQQQARRVELMNSRYEG
jgi:hypothetical protein